ncbi:MAG: hypothetical protein AB8G86_21985 [Saprospiraceae bacterium]
MNQKSIDKKIIKSVFEDMLKERNSELQSFLEELLAKFMLQSSDNKKPLDMVKIRQKYSLKREAFTPLHELLKDVPTAQELTSRLSK